MKFDFLDDELRNWILDSNEMFVNHKGVVVGFRTRKAVNQRVFIGLARKRFPDMSVGQIKNGIMG